MRTFTTAEVIGIFLAWCTGGWLLTFVYDETGWATTLILGLMFMGNTIRMLKEKK